MTRLTNEEVAKAFVRLRFPSAPVRSHNGNLYANNGVIFSYGPHFPICRYIGNNEWMLTNRNYSVTTARHFSLVRRHLPRDATVWTVVNVLATDNEAHLSNVANMISRAEQAMVGADRARTQRTRQARLDEANDLYAGAIKYCSRFLQGVFSLPAIDVYAPDVMTVLDRLRAQHERVIEEAHPDLTRRLKDLVRRFREGEPVRVPGRTALLRLRGNVIETSTGYAVLLDENRDNLAKLLDEIMNARRNAREKKRPNLNLGEYVVRRISRRGDVEIGCQTIEWPEIEQLAFRLGWIEELEDDDAA